MPEMFISETRRRRMPGRRRGSVLIMVVALLVILALMGTAWIATTYLDRGASQANVNNAQIDLLIDGVKNLAVQAVVSDVLEPIVSPDGNVQYAYRPRSTAAQPYGYKPYTSPIPSFDPNRFIQPLDHAKSARWLGSRVPVEDLVGGRVVWPAISAPLIVEPTFDPSAPTLPIPFESPLAGDDFLTVAPVDDLRLKPEPFFVTIPYGNGSEKIYPAFRLHAPGGGNKIILAADTDGDGVADAGLWRLTEQGGVTYYAASRIIDNNSAVNASVAWEWYPDLPAATLLPTNLFPTNVGLRDLLWVDPSLKPNEQDTARQEQVDFLNAYRFHFDFPVVPQNSPTTSVLVYGDYGQRLNDFKYLVANSGSGTHDNFAVSYDALWMQLGRRLDHPGYNWGRDEKGIFKAVPFRPMSMSDQAALAKRFILADPSEIPNSVLESRLLPTLVQRAPTVPFVPESNGPAMAAATVRRWFDTNFRYPLPGSSVKADPASRRCLLVARNPVSNHIAPATVTPAAPTLPPSVPEIMPSYYRGRDARGLIGPSPVKASVNTASFGELFRAYWSVMCDQPDPAAGDITPFADRISENRTALTDIYYGVQFDYIVGADGKSGNRLATPQQHPVRMFRSSLRDPSINKNDSVTRFEPSQQLLLRAALAAANTVQLRNPDYMLGTDKRYLTETNPSALHPAIVPVQLTALIKGQATPVTVVPYGVRPQPYITEVYVSTETDESTSRNPSGYIAIELHNPYPTPIDLRGWCLATIDRKRHPDPYRFNIQLLAQFDQTKVSGNGDKTTIDGGGYLVIENYNQASPAAGAAQFRPKAVDPNGTGTLQGKQWYVQNLDQVKDKELVILRPLKDGDTVSNVTNPSTVPVDQFDFTNPPVLEKDERAQAWHYARNSSDKWKCVYPGRYVGNLSNMPRHQGINQSAIWNPTTGSNPWGSGTADGVSITLGTAPMGAGKKSTYDKNEFVIQLCTKDMMAAPLPTDRFPFGGFARNGDVLDVPFIGAYRVYLGKVDNNPFTELVEINSISMDSVFAEDTYTDDDQLENIGRFCAIYDPTRTNLGYDFLDGVRDSANARQWRYRWATRIFDYLTVQAPHDDYTPNAPFEHLQRLYGQDPDRWPQEVRVANSQRAGNNSDAEHMTGVEGLININTAPWKVLATLPIVPKLATASVDDVKEQNERLALAVARYREKHGPFETLFDLLRVPEFRTLAGQITTGTRDPKAADGDITGDNPTGTDWDQVRKDYEEQYLLINRISNLATTRSDTFTCYILVQGWRYAGTDRPELVSQRRIGVFIDRNNVGGAGLSQQKNAKVTVFPAE